MERLASWNPEEHLPSSEFYSQVASELDAIGWDKLVSLNQGLTSIELQLQYTSPLESSLELVMTLSLLTRTIDFCFK